jgi:Legionella pneumophila major outer membrane protein precursor
MAAKALALLTAALLGAAAMLASSIALAQPLPSTPVPVLPPPAPPPDPAPPSLGAPRPAPFPGPPPPFSERADPGPNGWADAPSGEEGLFFNTELEFVKPAVKNRLSGVVTFPGGLTDNVQVPQTNLDWTVAPTFELGYRFPDSFGDLSASYRFLTSEGRGTIASGANVLDVRSRLDLNQVDFDYSSARFSPGPFWDLKWRVGARLADVFFDSRVSDRVSAGAFEQQASNNFIGAGPHFALDAERRIGLLPGFAAFGNIDGAVLVGQIHQRFHDGGVLNNGTPLGFDDTEQRTQSVPVLTLKAGFSYTPPRLEFVHFTTGYEFERWWDLARLGGSKGELTDQGIFLRAEFDY